MICNDGYVLISIYNNYQNTSCLTPQQAQNYPNYVYGNLPSNCQTYSNTIGYYI